MSTPRIHVDRGPITTLWLDRADKRNAIDGLMMRELGEAIDEIATDSAARVVVIRGRGTAFSSGMDHQLLTEVLADAQRVPFLHLHHALQDTFHRLERLGKPVIAAIHGACIGMALELVLAVDIRIASEDAIVGLPEIALGIVPDVGGTTRLVRVLGESRARELILTGRMLRARTAETYGLLHEVATDAADLERRVMRRATQLAAHPPTALALAKSLCMAAADSGTQTSYRLEGVVQTALLAQPDLAAQIPGALAFIKAGLADPE